MSSLDQTTESDNFLSRVFAKGGQHEPVAYVFDEAMGTVEMDDVTDDELTDVLPARHWDAPTSWSAYEEWDNAFPELSGEAMREFYDTLTDASKAVLIRDAMERRVGCGTLVDDLLHFVGLTWAKYGEGTNRESGVQS